jgi:hypothetical protein
LVEATLVHHLSQYQQVVEVVVVAEQEMLQELLAVLERLVKAMLVVTAMALHTQAVEAELVLSAEMP